MINDKLLKKDAMHNNLDINNFLINKELEKLKKT